MSTPRSLLAWMSIAILAGCETPSNYYQSQGKPDPWRFMGMTPDQVAQSYGIPSAAPAYPPVTRQIEAQAVSPMTGLPYGNNPLGVGGYIQTDQGQVFVHRLEPAGGGTDRMWTGTGQIYIHGRQDLGNGTSLYNTDHGQFYAPTPR